MKAAGWRNGASGAKTLNFRKESNAGFAAGSGGDQAVATGAAPIGR